jgi:antitoxin component YwqK of YwqJK toxin-antitoxin module
VATSSNSFRTKNYLMPTKEMAETEHVEYHRDGSVWAKGKKLNGALTGFWQWFRKDGTRLRSGHFENGEQVGEWITYDKQGQKYKVTNFKPKTKKQTS